MAELRLMVVEHTPITRLLGGDFDLDWCDVDPHQGMVIIPRAILPAETRAVPTFQIEVEYEAPAILDQPMGEP